MYHIKPVIAVERFSKVAHSHAICFDKTNNILLTQKLKQLT